MKQKGQTLVEGIVAIFIIIVGIVSALILAMSAFSGSLESEGQVKATNFAREALEVVRNVRDSNFLSRVDTGANFDDGLSYFYTKADFNEITNQWTVVQLDNGTNFDPLNCSPSTCQLYYHPSTGVFSHNSANGLATDYYRVLRFDKICRQYITTGNLQIITDGSDCPEDYPLKVGIRVLAKVSWIEGNQTRTLMIEDRIFDWK